MAPAGDALTVHVDKALTEAEAALVGDRAVIVGPDDDALAGAEVTVIGVGHHWDAARFSQFPNLRCVSRMGVGYDNVDVAAASAAGVTVCHAPAAPTVSTAEHAVALMLAVTKELPQQSERAQQGLKGPAVATSLELDGATLGLVGLGRIAQRVAVVGRALGLKVVATDPGHDDSPVPGVTLTSLDQLLEISDVVSLHAPALDSTHHLINNSALSLMKTGAYLINTARGSLVDHEAVLAALQAGKLGGAAFDVTEPEPLPAGHPLLERDDVLVTPHIASSTAVGRVRLFEHAFDNALDFLRGRTTTVVPEQT